MTLSKRVAVLVAVVAAVLFGAGTPVLAYPPVDVVHVERVQAGPYEIAVGFSTWPIRAMRSFDVTFTPDGGIAGCSGSTAFLAAGRPGRLRPLARHPRRRDVWGEDTMSLDSPGGYALRILVNGPRGRGEGTLAGLEVLEQPGPPLALSWTVASLPLVGLIVVVGVAWRRVRPGRHLTERSDGRHLAY